LQNKYGKEFALMCRANKNEKVNERLLLKMSEQAPGDLLVEKYLVEIAKSHNVQFKPDPGISVSDF
jgi:vacuolar protein sorting-associated protein IST1